MTETTKAIEQLERISKNLGSIGETEDYTDMAIKALEEVQRYRAIGTPEDLQTMKEHGAFTGKELATIFAVQMKLKKYEAIGTLDECRAAMEKQTAKKPIVHQCPACGNAVMLSDGKCCSNCGQNWIGVMLNE